ncbi:PREDICTED: profilin-4 isoform X2 [Gavialis gangeticus]|uniref:profilin-4 isoform X2 n=1 Tax=Gavialis gangeticus TaxID=94835 RepID=UPI00092E6639|nr:PREDICTED: profilin-4 isoform X2 [Gavialis gangeticus]
MNQMQALLNDCLLRTKHVEHAAIISLKKGTVYASTFGFNNLLQVRREGLYFKEKQYRCVRADEYSIYTKKQDGGLVAVKTKLYIVVGTYSEGMYPSVCVEAVEKLADYLREKGS